MPSTNRVLGAALALALAICSAAFAAEVMVGGAAMLPSKNIVDNASNSKDHATLVQAVKAAGLVETLTSKGPFTVFAPVNAAFAALPANTIEALLKPENKAELAKVLTYHVVAGKLTYDDIEKAIKAGGGEAKLPTVANAMLYARKNGAHNIVVKDETGVTANISTYDVLQSNGVIHVIDRVLLPSK
jgi:uncharacterized surface protein with fasciclin (FAS1) repeats